VAFKLWEKDNATATLPYQLFGMHYYSPAGKEVFLGAVFAFLMAYNDTYKNGTGEGLPNPGQEDVFYVLPFGVSRDYQNASYPPIVEAIAAHKIADGHYQFGISYKNLYAKIIGANSPGEFWLSAVLPIYIARFSELTVTYDIKIDPATHTASAETFYTIGEIQDLWIWGQRTNPHNLSLDFGLAAVHYGVIFTSDYTVENATGTKVGPNFEGATGDNLSFRIGSSDRFAKIGFRGTYDLFDEPDAGMSGANTLISTNNTAYNAVVKARATDTGLVRWQHAMSADIFSVFAFGTSAQVRAAYTSPQDLRTRASDNFTGTTFWYAVGFPHFQGYRIVHDPTYEAYYSDPAGSTPRGRLPGLDTPLVFGAVGTAILATVVLTGRHRRA
jgi:hypothetical protein